MKIVITRNNYTAVMEDLSNPSYVCMYVCIVVIETVV